MENKKKITLILIALVSFASLVFVIKNLTDGRNPFKNSDSWVNAVDEAKQIDKSQFIDYKIDGNNENSNELIAVIFNTDNEYNLGFIDEFGNVVASPFLKVNYDYSEKLRGHIGIDKYFGEYYEFTYMRENELKYAYYDKNFNKVELSDIEKNQFINDANYKIPTKITEKKFSNLNKCIARFLKEGYVMNDYNIGYNDEIYDVSFAYDNYGYHILMDNNFKLFTQLYFPDTTSLNLFVAPDKGSIVGNFFVKDLGLVYYNTLGNIIWITYCK